MHPRVTTQAYLVSAIPLIFLLLVFAVAILIEQASKSGAAFEQQAQKVLNRETAIETLITAASRGAIRTKGGPDFKPIDNLDRELPAAHAQLLRDVQGQPGMPQRVRTLINLDDIGSGVIRHYANLVAAGQVQKAKTYAASPQVQALGTQLSAAQVAIKNSERAWELSSLNGLRQEVARYETALIVCCAAGIVLTLMVSGRFGVGIAERLRRLAHNAERLADGQSVEPMEGHDEFADLDKVYQAMMARIAREHAVASTLQRVLLPERLPKVDGIRIDSVYVPAAIEEGIGGDWYDVFALSERLLCISVGDVAGHGLRAARMMAGARLAIRSAARIDESPAKVLENANRVLCADEPETVVTAFVAVLDLSNGALRYASAGHPPPLLLSPSRDATFLDARGFMLGADMRATYEEEQTSVKEGWALVIYTDGVIENRRDYFRGQDDLVTAATMQFVEPSENIAESILHGVLRDAKPRDDAAVLFIGVTKLGGMPAARRTWTLDAREETSSRRVKRALLWHLGEIAREPSDFNAVELIFGELIGNVARHTPGPAEVSLDCTQGKCTLRVADRGKAFEPSSNGGADLLSESGRGLFLVRMMARDLHVEHAGGGNVVSAVLPVALAG